MDFNRTHITTSAEETNTLARDFINEILTSEPSTSHLSAKAFAKEEPLILCLYGNLGSGKTTFTQGVAEALHISGRILSPTFILMRQYEFGDHKTLSHLDLYNLKESEALKGISLNELFTDPDQLIIIEWADKLGNMLPKNRYDIFFEALEEGSHRISIVIPA